MSLRRITICLAMVMLILSVGNTSLGAAKKDLLTQEQLYKMDLNKIKALRKSLELPLSDWKYMESYVDSSKMSKDKLTQIRAFKKSLELKGNVGLQKYCVFIDEIQKKWVNKNKEYYACLMLEASKQLYNGRFGGCQRYRQARKYALLALADPNKIRLRTELDLIGYTINPIKLEGAEWVKQRSENVRLRLKALQRLLDAIDPNWDPNDKPMPYAPLPSGVLGGFPGINPSFVKDPKLRAEYELAIKKNDRKAEIYGRQYELRRFRRTYQGSVERYIIKAYSLPPYKLDELKHYLKKYLSDKMIRDRIVKTVEDKIKRI